MRQGARQIARAIRKLRCDALDADEARLRQRYARDTRLPAALDKARKLIQ
jgi:hypothetical protein